jgi:hypothetical protein
MKFLHRFAARPLLVFATLTSLVLCAAQSATAAPRVDLEIALMPGFVPTDLAAWNEMLSGVGVDNLRLGGSGNATKKIALEQPDGSGTSNYRVFGVLTPGNELLLPGAKFSRSSKAALTKWISDLKTAGPPKKPGEKPLPFGLQPAQLEAIGKDLGTRADFSTTGQSVKQVLIEVGNRTKNALVAEPQIAAGLNAMEKVPGELKGLACGTVLAAVLRREGLSMVPRATSSGGIEYFITRARADQDVWPVGWPAEKPIPEMVPDLFTLRNVQIDDIPASQLLTVVAERVKVPMLFDEQAILQKKIDVSKIRIKIPEGKLGYQGVLDRTMFQAGMKHEVRIDDAGRPFLWITAR